jgi:hypothetical protein
MQKNPSHAASMAIVAVAICVAAARAESPFFQAFQAPTPARAGLYSGSGAAPTMNDSGQMTLLPPVQSSGDSPEIGPSPDQPGFVSSTTIDQPLLTPAPTSLAGLTGGMLMPWQLADTPCDDCQKQGIYIFHNYSSWRGISEGSGENNNGFSYGVNYGTRLGALTDYTGIGAQLGASYGLYDLNGRSSGFHDNRIQQQTFVTAGVFRPADRLTNFSFGVVWDGMFNADFGQYAVSPFLSQLRYQIAYALNAQHEVGVWGTNRLSGDTFNLGGPLSYRAVDQINLFWHHRFAFGGDGWTWVGVPDHTKLGGSGSLGAYTFGGTLTAPLSPCFAAFTSLQYMAPSARTGTAAAMEETFYVTLGVTFYPYANSRASNVSGNCWMPYMPVANNGTFLVDTNRTF